MTISFDICRVKVVVIMTALVIGCASNIFGQKELDSLLRKFDRYRTNNPQEKLYVDTDRELYLTGETLWFKIYYVDGALHLPSDFSKVAYVEILDDENKVMLQAKTALKEGEGQGTLFIPASITTGNYHLRAYTQWMKNFDADFFFHKKISIVNAFRKLEKEEAGQVQPFSAQFFPEGGDLVYGLASKVAFQVIDSRGNGIDFSGTILNSQNDTVASIHPHRFGIGNFTLTPAAGLSYRAVVTDTLGKALTFNLPTPRNSGYVMDVRDSTSDLLKINISWAHPSETSSVIYYVIHARQIIAATGTVAVGKQQTSILIQKKQLREGISHITIFDRSLMPQCERLYFKPSTKKLLIQAKVNQNEYGVRRKVVVDISSDNTQITGDASLSVAVVKSDSLEKDVSGDLFHYLWLTSDLKGIIEAPEFYASADSPEVSIALDNLMLTHGWRRFGWNEVLTNKKTKHLFIPEYRGHLIRGTVTDAAGAPAPGIATYLSSPSKVIQLYTARSKANGEVQYEMKDFFGPRKIIIQTNTQQDSLQKIRIHSPYSDVYAKIILPPLVLQPDVAKHLLTRSVAMQVQDIYYGENAIRFKNPHIDSTAFYGKASETYFLDDYTRFPVMEEVMREYVPGVLVRKRRDGFHFLVLDNVRKSVFQSDPLIMLDGMPVFDVDKIMAFDPLKVKKLEVLTTRYFLGPLVFPGVVSYSTYGGDLGGYQLDQKSVSMDYEGLQRQRIFYSPQYDTEKQRASRMPDRRNLLFWSADVLIGKEGKRQLEFYTSDLTGNYAIIIEGLSKNGYAGSAVGSFSVREFNN
jgi:hypothetical protein